MSKDEEVEPGGVAACVARTRSDSTRDILIRALRGEREVHEAANEAAQRLEDDGGRLCDDDDDDRDDDDDDGDDR